MHLCITALRGHNAKCRASLPEHRYDVLHKLLRFFMRSEVTPMFVLRLKYDVSEGESPAVRRVLSVSRPTSWLKFSDDVRSRRTHDLFRKKGESQRYRRPLHAVSSQAGKAVGHLVIDTQRRCRARAREPVDRHPFEHCVTRGSGHHCY